MISVWCCSEVGRVLYLEERAASLVGCDSILSLISITSLKAFDMNIFCYTYVTLTSLVKLLIGWSIIMSDHVIKLGADTYKESLLMVKNISEELPFLAKLSAMSL